MSTAVAPILDAAARTKANLAALSKRMAASPLEFSTRSLMTWQRVVRALCGGAPWDSAWGPAPSCPPTEINVVTANQVGKTRVGGHIVAEHVLGKLPRWAMRGELWTGSETLDKSVDVQRGEIGMLLGKGEIARWVHRHDKRAEGTLVTRAGWKCVQKSYGQGATTWTAARLQGIHIDEPPPDSVIAESRIRLTRHNGYLLITQTPLRGINTKLYESAYAPFADKLPQLHARARKAGLGKPCKLCNCPEYGPLWAEVSPGVWVVTAGMRDNRFLPPSAVDARERELLKIGRRLEARVRIHGEWLDVSEDRIIPVELLRQWSEIPRGGFLRKIGWIDTALSKGEASCETSIAIAGASVGGQAYLVESLHGRWQSDERVKNCADALVRHDCPQCYVQGTWGDELFADQVNAELMRRGARACVTAHPDKVTDKVTRGNLFAPMVAAGQVYIRPEHGAESESFRRQASVFSASYLKAGGLCDTLDAGMGALMAVMDLAGDPAAWGVNDRAHVAQQGASVDRPWSNEDDDPARDETYLPDWLASGD